MQTTTTAYNNAVNAPVRTVKATAKVYTGSTLNATYTESDSLVSIEIQRVGDANKFFGFGVCQRLNLKLRDIQRVISVSTQNTIVITLGIKLASGIEYKAYPKFYVSEVHRNENTNELSITAYDIIDKLNDYTVADIEIAAPYTLSQFATAAAAVIGTTCSIPSDSVWATSYPEGANFEGTETLREAMTMLAEATQTIFYANTLGNIVFKRLGGTTDLAINKDSYFSLSSGNNKRLQTICHCTELGDNVSESTVQIGSTQYIRNNAFWELRDDIATLVHNALVAVGDFSINVFDCKWRGNPSLEVGDKISLITKDNNTVYAYVLNDVITYNGALSQKTKWSFEDELDTADVNPTSLGAVLKQTYARVDKANRVITLVASDVDSLRSDTAQLQIDKSTIEANISSITTDASEIAAELNKFKETTAEQDELNAEKFSSLERSVDTKMTDEEVTIKINTALSNGVGKVETSTGYSFTDDGLNITKTGSDISTIIDEDGMDISQNGSVVLTANHSGVDAKNLRATTYLIIGETSRFEDWYGSTACFWIGGNS